MAGQNNEYRPTYADVLVVKAMLGRIGILPPEIVDDIVDHAQYWPHTHVHIPRAQNGNNNIVVPSPRTGENFLLCRTPPLGFLRPPVPDAEAAVQYSTASLPPRPLPNPGPTHPGHDAACLPDAIQTWLPDQQAKPVEHPCRKIEFTITSHDQGWSDNRNDRGTYIGTYTWFDVGLERYGKAPDADDETTHPSESTASPASPGSYRIPAGVELYSIKPEVVEDGPSYAYEHPLMPNNTRLQSNRVGIREPTTHNIVWSWTDRGTPAAQEDPLERIGRGALTGNGDFVRTLCVGDVVTVWAKARFPGWHNNIQSVDVDVYWAV